SKSDRTLAAQLATEAVDLARREFLDSKEEVSAQLNLASLNPERVDLTALEGEIEALPDSEDQVEFYLDLAKISPKPFPLLQRSLSVAQAVGSARTLSWAWGDLGLYWEKQGDFLEALNASHKAAQAAQEVSDWVKLANWQWLAARAYQQLGQSDKALAAYRHATDSVRQLRQELAGSPVGPSLYLDTIDPLLRDFLGFLLSQNAPSDELLEEAIAVLRLNQLSELDNYFGDICQVSVLSNPPRPSDTLTIYTVLLPQQAYEILELSDGSYRLVQLAVSGEALKKQVFRWRQQLVDQLHQYYLEGSSRLYQMAISPVEEQLQQVSHLVFVQDGILRTVPMAALYDTQREQFLIEQYSVSYSLGLGENLVATRPQLPLIAASSESSPAFPNPIPGVLLEAQQIEAVLGGGTQLLNSSFTPQALETQLENEDYELLHLASHSRFTGLVE
ncbi:MAG: CHAT domain-containing protein, partial [Microcystaceae cyanobacterium]